MNFLELTNAAIQESGVDLDDLTAVNFAVPPRTIMYSRMKRWINRAYKEILQKREEWYTLQERTVHTIYPRIQVNLVATTVVIGDEYQGLDSGVRFLVRRITSDGYADGEVELTPDLFLDIEYSDPQDTSLIVGESISRLAPTVVANAMKLEAYAGYDFSLDVPDIKEVDLNSISFQRVPNSVIDDHAPGMPMPVYQVVWDKWDPIGWPDPYAHGQPQFVTRGPDGLIQFWPRLDIPYSVQYSYSRVIVDMVLWDDIPKNIPSDCHMAVVWKAVMKYARFDNKDKLFLNARDEFRFFNNKLEENKLPEVTMGGNVFWV